jgi:hypothetical protein
MEVRWGSTAFRTLETFGRLGMACKRDVAGRNGHFVFVCLILTLCGSHQLAKDLLPQLVSM